MQFSRNVTASDPQITIGMPICENARTLRRSIESVRAQSFENWHLMISDDRSTDAGPEIAEKAAQEDPRITFVINPVREGFMNFRVALAEAQTPYFVWLAGDDYWHQDFLAHTISALEAAPLAVSALPNAAFVDGSDRDVPNLGFLRGHPSDRIRRYLAYPGGTRMYGLMRTKAARAAFPPQTVNAYDWYFMVSLLKRGPQLSVPQCLLFREKTYWIRYAEIADGLPTRRLFRRYPILQMSLMLLRDRRVPLTALSALVRLNCRKHEEYLAVLRPKAFMRRFWIFGQQRSSIARDPQKLRELAQYHQDRSDPAVGVRFEKLAASIGHGVASPAVVTSSGATAPVATAILTCRNAEATLEAWLGHMERLNCRTIIVDDGSSDKTREIAAAHRGDVVADIIEHSFEGYFDLAKQLQYKREIIADLPEGWVIHADADEFLDSPEGMSLAELLRAAEKESKIAIPSIEHLYLPRFEDEEHDCENFEHTMLWRTIMREHDEKQRIFHTSAPLDVWMKTGGHTVSRRADDVTKTQVVLRHYPGLSLDRLRGQYYSRVFASHNLKKLWHTRRMASRYYDVVEPDPAWFAKVSEPAPECEMRWLPIFNERKLSVVNTAIGGRGFDIVVLNDDQSDREEIRTLIDAACPGMRCYFTSEAEKDHASRSLPVLHILLHPSSIHGHGVRRSKERSLASAWVRRIAAARQISLERMTPYAELRIEDLQEEQHIALEMLRSMFLGGQLTETKGFIRSDVRAITKPRYANPVKAITASLAADIGYR